MLQNEYFDPLGFLTDWWIKLTHELFATQLEINWVSEDSKILKSKIPWPANRAQKDRENTYILLRQVIMA